MKAIHTLALFCTVFLFAVQAWAYQAHVVAVRDGDTVILEGGDRVRLAAIDAPESAWPGRWGDQPGADQARAALAALVLGKVVEVTPAGQARSYGRLVAWIDVDGVGVNAELVREGWAWVERRFCRPACEDLWKMQDEARQARAGVWAGEAPVPPWRWRRGEVSSQAFKRGSYSPLNAFS